MRRAVLLKEINCTEREARRFLWVPRGSFHTLHSLVFPLASDQDVAVVLQQALAKADVHLFPSLFCGPTKAASSEAFSADPC